MWAHSWCSIFIQIHEDFLSDQSVVLFFFFILEVSSRFDAATLQHVWIWVWYCLVCVYVFVLYLELVAHGTLSPVRMEGDTPTEMRQGDGSSKDASRWPGRMRTEKKKQKKTCIRSHCASNVITGSDTTMWHATLPICQSEIGRVTNGYRCCFPQPPPPPPPPVLMSAEEGWPKPGW